MDRRAFLAGSAALLAAPLAAEAQQAGKIYRIGFLTSAAQRSDPIFVHFWEEAMARNERFGQLLKQARRGDSGRRDSRRSFPEPRSGSTGLSRSLRTVRSRCGFLG